MGYDPTGSAAQRYYTTGFKTGTMVNAHDSGTNAINGISCIDDAKDDGTGKSFSIWKKVAGHTPAAGDIEGSSVDPDGSWFVAAAGGRISADGGEAITTSIFKVSMEAYATATDSETNTGQITDVETGDGSISVWALTKEKKLFKELLATKFFLLVISSLPVREVFLFLT